MREIRFAWVCRNKTFNTIMREELTDNGLLSGARPSWITSNNCEILAKILPTGLYDKHNTEIWEGDILLLAYAGLQIKKMGIVKWHDDTASFCIYIQDGIASMSKGVQSRQDEIIGDIYRNPDLIPHSP